ncbi:hypothetical protein HN419_05240 [Candidatus Woesearchaeota archaeon]|jgi:hypothetical protein|nr:hypothetical protein [Candidatus Woesearchaeota archaeon]MBT3537724.1 hypothetical protein [Candidatus Woesearchaeota archaeon]MBT4697855.1 hypothetical protein [Candidatus Woesearchaeota archaeon]MBT4717485.1 hypothetical protein [Candidatus Woesearchaeota archaeon]MBT7105393.1 hypothetical protein [Candidatus Woesearchaeota archaeon]
MFMWHLLTWIFVVYMIFIFRHYFLIEHSDELENKTKVWAKASLFASLFPAILISVGTPLSLFIGSGGLIFLLPALILSYIFTYGLLFFTGLLIMKAGYKSLLVLGNIWVASVIMIFLTAIDIFPMGVGLFLISGGISILYISLMLIIAVSTMYIWKEEHKFLSAIVLSVSFLLLVAFLFLVVPLSYGTLA